MEHRFVNVENDRVAEDRHRLGLLAIGGRYRCGRLDPQCVAAGFEPGGQVKTDVALVLGSGDGGGAVGEARRQAHADQLNVGSMVGILAFDFDGDIQHTSGSMSDLQFSVEVVDPGLVAVGGDSQRGIAADSQCQFVCQPTPSIGASPANHRPSADVTACCWCRGDRRRPQREASVAL